MPVIYGGYSLRPGPHVAFTIERQTLSDGRYVGMVVRATLTGKIVVENPAGTHVPVDLDSRLTKILERQTAIREAFAEDGKMFEVQGWDGSAPTKFTAKVKSIEFGEGNWTELSDYTIVLEGDEIAGEDVENLFIEQATENWSFEESDNPKTTRVTHNLSAKGRTVYDAAGTIPKPAWKYAREFVETKLGLGFEKVIAEWSPKSGKQHAADSAAKPATTIEWNHTVQETIDELDGNYSVVETWLLSQDPFIDDWTVGIRRVQEDGVTTTASINGTIRGLFKKQGEEFKKYEEARSRWEVVRDLLFVRCQAVVATVKGRPLSPHPTSASVEHNETEGTVTYNYEFQDKEYVEDTTDTWVVTKRVTVDDHRTVVSIEGTITGAVYLDDTANKVLKFQRAADRWAKVRLLVLARAVSSSGVTTLKAFPVQAQVVSNEEEGTITYNYDFDDRERPNIRHEYTVTKRRSRQDAIDTVSIEGTITGLRTGNANNPYGTGNEDERYNNAKSYFSTIEPNLLGLAATYVDTSKVKPEVVNSSVSHSPPQGTITYSAEFNSTPKPCFPGALSESITITDDDAVPIIAIIPILGRKKGPLFQDIGTFKEKRRSVTAEVIMEPAANPCVMANPPAYNVNIYAPSGDPVYKETDQTTWSPQTGRLTKTVSWVYTS